MSDIRQQALQCRTAAQALALAQAADGLQKRLLLACVRALAEHRPLPCPWEV